MMESMDAGIGTILDTVQACGIDEQTLVMFFSDNGPSGPGSAGPLRGQKGTVYEGGHRVPAAARWPGTLPAGTVTEVPCMGMDLFPTMTRLANVSRPEHPLDGIDLFPLMARGAEFPDRPLFWRYGENIAVREGRWKLVLNRKSPPYTELFDLETDLSETKDLTLCHPEVVSDLLHKLRVWETDVDQSPSQLPSTS
jgi:arylsulfatase A-like enzyme